MSQADAASKKFQSMHSVALEKTCIIKQCVHVYVWSCSWLFMGEAVLDVWVETIDVFAEIYRTDELSDAM